MPEATSCSNLNANPGSLSIVRSFFSAILQGGSNQHWASPASHMGRHHLCYAVGRERCPRAGQLLECWPSRGIMGVVGRGVIRMGSRGEWGSRSAQVKFEPPSKRGWWQRLANHNFRVNKRGETKVSTVRHPPPCHVRSPSLLRRISKAAPDPEYSLVGCDAPSDRSGAQPTTIHVPGGLLANTTRATVLPVRGHERARYMHHLWGCAPRGGLGRGTSSAE